MSTDTLIPVMPRESEIAEDSGPSRASIEAREYVEREFGENIEWDDVTPKILYDFAKEFSNPVLYDAAGLVDVIDQIERGDKDKALRSLGAYMSHEQSEDKVNYLLDKVLCIGYVNRYIDKVFESIKEVSPRSVIDLKSAIDPNSDKKVGNQTWLEGQIAPDIEGLKDLTDNLTDYRPIILKAAQILRDLKDPNTPDSERMRNVIAVETTYAPLCEILGFEALASTLVSEVNCTRLEKSGNGKYIEMAKKLIDSLGEKAEVEEFVENMPNWLIGESDAQSIVDAGNGYGTFFAVAHSAFKGKNGEIKYFDVVSRRKTLGSLAMKLYRYAKEAKKGTPVDLIGMTVIADDTEGVADMFKHIVEKIKDDPRAKLTPASSRDEALHVKGTEEFREKVLDALRQTVDDPVDQPSEETDFRVAKITFTLDVQDRQGKEFILPIEIQVLDKESRRQGKYGSCSHIAHKLRKYNGPVFAQSINFKKFPSYLQMIRDQKDTDPDPDPKSLYRVSPKSMDAINKLKECIMEAYRSDYLKNPQDIGKKACYSPSKPLVLTG